MKAVRRPPFWGGVEKMPEIGVAEMVCDWYARGQEFGTGLHEWISEHAVPRFGIDPTGEQYRWITAFIDLLLHDYFIR